VEPVPSEIVGLPGTCFGCFEGTKSSSYAQSMVLAMAMDLNQPFLILGEAAFPVKLVSSNVRHLKSFL